MSNRNSDDDPLESLELGELLALTDLEFDRRKAVAELRVWLDRLDLDELALERADLKRLADLRLAAFAHALTRAPQPVSLVFGRDADGDDGDDIPDTVDRVARWLDTVEQVADAALRFAGLEE